MHGVPFSSRNETSASPTASSVMTRSALTFGLGRSVSAAVLTAFWSLGVKARSACCTRLPSWPSTVGGENARHAFAVLHAHEIGDVEHRLAEELRPALALEREEAPLDGADRGGGDVAVLRLELRGVVADMLQHRAQVLQVEEQQPIVVRDLENDGEHALLDFIQSEHAPEKQRPHVRDRRAH